MESKIMDFEFEAKGVSEEGVFSGYASTFGGSPDSHGDIIVEGAFRDSLIHGGRNGTGIAMLWQHDSAKPIGVWTGLAENARGLKVSGNLAINTSLGKDVYELMKMGAVKGLSIGFGIDDYDKDVEYDDKKRTRKLKKVNLWEISPVTFPANTRANITSVKSMIETAQNERELEKALRDVMSVSSAKYIVSLCKDKLFSLRDLGNGDVKNDSEDLFKTKEGIALSNLLEGMQFVNESFEVKKVIPFKSYQKLPLKTIWEGGSEIKKADTKGLKVMSTWYDSSNPDVKGSYKLPHHRAESYSTVWKGVAAAMAVLLGARGGADIPNEDIQGVYNHLSKHYDEFEKEAPEMREYSMYELKQIFPEMFEI